MQSHSCSNRLDFDRKFVTSGWRGNIFRCKHFGISYCLKKAVSKEFCSNIQREVLLLEKVQLLGLSGYTHLIASGEDWFVCDWIDAIPFDRAWNDPLYSKETLVQGLINRAFILDTHGIEHGELHRPMSNVLVDDTGGVYVIDFDQGSFANTKNKNLRHVMQWMMREKLLSLEEVRIFAGYNGEKLYENLLQWKLKIVE